jgi:hypothetical protein
MAERWLGVVDTTPRQVLVVLRTLGVLNLKCACWRPTNAVAHLKDLSKSTSAPVGLNISIDQYGLPPPPPASIASLPPSLPPPPVHLS